MGCISWSMKYLKTLRTKFYQNRWTKIGYNIESLDYGSIGSDIGSMILIALKDFPSPSIAYYLFTQNKGDRPYGANLVKRGYVR